MLPIMKIMAERFVNGENPYQKINEIWGGMEPIYLPAMWLWYSLSIILKIDLRWINIIFMLLGLFLFLIKKNNKVSIYDFLLLFLVSFFLIESLNYKNQDWFILTEEPLVAGYYLLLAYALKECKPIMIGIIISLCLLSRYVLLFWLFAYLFYAMYDIKYVKKIIVTVVVLCISLFILTQAYSHVDVFIKTPNGYLSFILTEQGKGVYDTTIKNSLGLAKFFKLENLFFLHYLSMFCIFLIPFIFFLFKKSISGISLINIYSIAVLKLCLVFFFNLLIIPEHYLFITPTLYTVALLSIYINDIEVK
jgi:hypothetical protein